jgi:hypothetical protein
LIIALAPFSISEHGIGFINLPQFFSGYGLLARRRKEIRMMFFDEISVGRPNFISAR